MHKVLQLELRVLHVHLHLLHVLHLLLHLEVLLVVELLLLQLVMLELLLLLNHKLVWNWKETFYFIFLKEPQKTVYAPLVVFKDSRVSTIGKISRLRSRRSASW